ncbi:MAG: hypothetical protein ACR2RA_09225 [Geminicoccaceae bacterium]
MQYTLSTLTREQSFIWEDPAGRNLVIRPLGTFRSGNHYCRDYEVGFEISKNKPARRTACRIGDRWADVDPSKLAL